MGYIVTGTHKRYIEPAPGGSGCLGVLGSRFPIYISDIPLPPTASSRNSSSWRSGRKLNSGLSSLLPCHFIEALAVSGNTEGKDGGFLLKETEGSHLLVSPTDTFVQAATCLSISPRGQGTDTCTLGVRTRNAHTHTPSFLLHMPRFC